MKSKSDIEPVNLTPMIDIVFQMIIFFVFTLDLEREKFDKELEIAEAKKAPEIIEFIPASIYPQVLRDGTVKIGSAVVNERTFRGIIQGAIKNSGGRTDIPVLIYAEGETPHKHIMRIMDICSQEKLYDIRIIGLLEKSK